MSDDVNRLRHLERSYEQMGPTAVALSLLTAALWGGNAVATRFSVDTLPPLAVAALRFALATAFMLVWCRAGRSELRLRRGQWAPALIAGGLLFLQIGTFTIGVALSSSSHATVLINSFPFWVVAIEHYVTREDRLTTGKALGLLAAGGGTLLLISMTAQTGTAGEQLDPPSLPGDAILVLSAALLGIKIVYTRYAVRTVESGKLILWHDVVGTALFIAASALFEDVHWERTNLAAWLGILYQGILVGGLCFAVQARLLRFHSGSQISVFNFTTPVFGVALAVLLRGDALSPWLLVAGAAVAVGILLVNRQ